MKKFLLLTLIILPTLALWSGAAYAQHCDVKKGDSMWNISKRYKVDFSEVLQLNKHFRNQNMIHPKDEIELPDGSTGNETTNDSSNDNIQESNEVSSERGESSQAEEILKLVNDERTKKGLTSLTLNSKLTSVANTKSEDMAENNYFDHNSPTYGSPFEMLQQFGITYSSAGENIAAGQQSAQAVMNDWMNSSGHRANILNRDYTELGVGYATGGSYGTYWCQEFINP